MEGARHLAACYVAARAAGAGGKADAAARAEAGGKADVAARAEAGSKEAAGGPKEKEAAPPAPAPAPAADAPSSSSSSPHALSLQPLPLVEAACLRADVAASLYQLLSNRLMTHHEMDSLYAMLACLLQEAAPAGGFGGDGAGTWLAAALQRTGGQEAATLYGVVVALFNGRGDLTALRAAYDFEVRALFLGGREVRGLRGGEEWALAAGGVGPRPLYRARASLTGGGIRGGRP